MTEKQVEKQAEKQAIKNPYKMPENYDFSTKSKLYLLNIDTFCYF